MPGQARKANQLQRVHHAMSAHGELRTLPVELGLGDVAHVREPTRIFEASGEHRGDKHGSLHLPW
jgi:hypothetical protein